MPPEGGEEEGAPGSVAAWSSAGDLPSPSPGSEDARYAPGGELGRGGMGVVTVAHDRWLDRDVARKRPKDAADAARLRREARLTARINHPDVPAVFDVGEDADGAFYTMPVLAGRTLEERLRTGDLALPDAVDALQRAALAVGAAHTLGIVHRDVKPANLLLGERGERCVLDWGVALDPEAPDQARVGTDGFRAPEVDAGGLPTPACDVFGLGRTLAAILARTQEVPALRAVVTRATAPDPAARYPDGLAFAEELRRWREGERVAAHDAAISEVLALFWRRHRRNVSALAAGFAVLLVVAGVGFRAREAERARADVAHAAALATAAQTAWGRGAVPEALTLAAYALDLAEAPLARGILLAPAPPFRRTGTAPLPCAAPFVTPDGHALCASEAGIAAHRPPRAGTRGLSASPDRVLPGVLRSTVAEIRRFDGDHLLVRTTENTLTWWSPDAPPRAIPLPEGRYGLADGALPALFDATRVGLFDSVRGEITWGPPTCGLIERAAVEVGRVVILCREAEGYDGTLAEPGAPLPVPGHGSAVLARREGAWIGTFRGQVFDTARPEHPPLDAGIGAIRAILPSGDLAVLLGERGAARLWDPATGELLSRLPGRARAIAVTPAEILLFAEEVRGVRLDPAIATSTLDLRAQGGISALDVSAGGRAWVAGSATGDVVLWDAQRQALSRPVAPMSAAVKAVKLVDPPPNAPVGEARFLYSDLGPPAQTGMAREQGAAPPFSEAFARAIHRFGGELWLLPWSDAVIAVDAAGAERRLPLPARPIAAAGAFVVDERGGVHERAGEGFAPRFPLQAPSPVLALHTDLLVAADDERVVAYDRSGAARWSWRGEAAITALVADSERVVVGDADGTLTVLDPRGARVARLPAHTRQVSALILDGDALYSASWDGFARRHDLSRLNAPATELIAAFAEHFRLDREAALRGAP